MKDACVAGYGTVSPYPVSTERFLEVDREMRARHGQSPEVAELVAKFVEGTGIVSRHVLHPAWLQPDDPRRGEREDIFTPADFDPPLWQRERFWQRHFPPMAVEAARAALADWGGDPGDVTHIITTGTSGWIEPGVACEVIHALGLPLDCQKAELNFNGCFCGATCLRLARDIVRGGEAKAVLVVAGESASTHYNPVDTDVSTLVASALFSDGAAAFVLAPEGRWRFEAAGMSLVPDSRHMLTFAPPSRPMQESYKMFLHREVGAALGAYFRQGNGRALLDRLVERCGGVLPAMAVHPGGPNILEAVSEVLLERGWPTDVLAKSFETFHQRGNLGSTAILFVLANMLGDLEAERLVSFAFGPGVTVEWSLLRRT
ncbi:MAG: hypothetical protein AB7N76_23695 [Planctomycetota bacterium]